MPPKPIYEITLDNYLFSQNELVNVHEEKVRQWLLFELMSSYGYSINQISAEETIKIGSKNYHADVVISSYDKKAIVIECKKLGDKKPEKGLEQAQSYAERLKAEFAVYSNGKDWLVTRQINGTWEACIDIPTCHQIDGENPLEYFLYAIDEIKPILFWLYKEIPKEETTKYLKSIQTIFHASTVVTQGIDSDLSYAIDNLARAFTVENTFDGYSQGKFSTAINRFRAFANKVKPDPYLNMPLQSAREEAKYTRLKLHDLVETSMGITSVNLFATRLSVALLEYAEDTLDAQYYSKAIDNLLPRTVNNEFFKLLDYLLKVNLNISLPDQLNTMEINGIQSATESAWNNFRVEEKATISDYWFFLTHWFRQK